MITVLHEFVCLFVCLGFSSHSRIFHSYGDVAIAGEGLQIVDHEFYKLEKVDSEQRDLHFMQLLRDFTSVKHCPIPSFPGDGKANDIISFFSRMCEVMRKNIAYSRKYIES